MVYGYARVASPEPGCEETLNNQAECLREYGAIEIYKEQGSGLVELPVLHNLLMKLQKGDKLIVRSLSRLTRDIHKFNSIMTDLHERGVDFVAIGDCFILSRDYEWLGL